MFVARAVANKTASQRMTLTSNTSTPGTSAGQLTGWTADAAYPATNIVSSALVVDKAGVINITSNCVVSVNNLGGTVTGYIYKNGASIGSANTTSTGTLNLNQTGVSVNAGDTIAMYASCSFSSATIAATTTFITIVSQ